MVDVGAREQGALSQARVINLDNYNPVEWGRYTTNERRKKTAERLETKMLLAASGGSG